MSNIIAIGLVTAGLCAGNVPAKMEQYIVDDLRYCVWKTDVEYNKCIDNTMSLFFDMAIHHMKCFEGTVENGDIYISGRHQSDGTWSQFIFRGKFRGEWYSINITQIKKIDDEAFAKRIQQQLKEYRHW